MQRLNDRVPTRITGLLAYRFIAVEATLAKLARPRMVNRQRRALLDQALLPGGSNYQPLCYISLPANPWATGAQ